MARLLVFRDPAGKVYRVDVYKVRGVRLDKTNRDHSVIVFKSGRNLIVSGTIKDVKERIIANKRIEREKLNVEFKNKLDRCAELSDEFLRRYLEIKGAL